MLEGGAIHVDGEGTLLTTEECLLNKNRNPDLSRGAIERELAAYTGARKIVWLGQGVYNDETDGHVDNLACFARPGVVLLTWTDDTSDPQHAISKDAFERLSKMTDAKGRAFQVVKLNQPGPLMMSADEARGVDAVEGSQPARRERASRDPMSITTSRTARSSCRCSTDYGTITRRRRWRRPIRAASSKACPRARSCLAAETSIASCSSSQNLDASPIGETAAIRANECAHLARENARCIAERADACLLA